MSFEKYVRYVCSATVLASVLSLGEVTFAPEGLTARELADVQSLLLLMAGLGLAGTLYRAPKDASAQPAFA